ncbi:hypothetical protein BN133_3708 [Cronobacter dublinensis 582]|nr:hypothetical protein BN133_3708 [Cronobacter dublinensis 582]
MTNQHGVSSKKGSCILRPCLTGLWGQRELNIITAENPAKAI